MQKPKKGIVWTLICLTVLIFCVYIIPNSSASLNRAMVSMYEPDEGAAYDVIVRMTLPEGRVDEKILRFILYDYYHYGFPFFGLAGLTALPFRLTGNFENTAALMATLRQVVSVLPSLFGILLLVYMQDQFSSWRSIALFLLLNLFPGVVLNNLWLHPDGLAFFFATIVVYFLWRDKRQFKKFFNLAAFFCGVLIATKLIGVYFFLTIATLLIIAIVRKELSFNQAVGKGLLFIGVMGLGLLAANPFMFDWYALGKYAVTFLKQMGAITKGYELVYATGISEAIKPLQEAFGLLFFILMIIMALIYGAFRGKDRHLYTILLTWFIPLTVVVLLVSHFKYQYWLPAIVCAASALNILLPGNSQAQITPRLGKPLALLASALILLQAGLFATSDVNIIQEKIYQSDNDPRILFYEEAIESLNPLTEQGAHLYYDYRLYLPENPLWWQETSFEMLNYSFIEDGNFDALLLLKQRILDYTNPNAVGIDPEELATARIFYNDASSGTIRNYVLLFEDEVGKVFVRKDVCSTNFSPAQCQ
jgi:hypothetical protein